MKEAAGLDVPEASFGRLLSVVMYAHGYVRLRAAMSVVLDELRYDEDGVGKTVVAEEVGYFYG